MRRRGWIILLNILGFVGSVFCFLPIGLPRNPVLIFLCVVLVLIGIAYDIKVGREYWKKKK